MQAYEADRLTGSVAVDSRVPNRNVSIPLIVGAGMGGIDEFNEASKALRAKVGTLQMYGGWIKRDSGNGPLYADIVKGTTTLTFPDHWGQDGIEGDVVLKFEALPDFYGDERALDVLTSQNGYLSAVLTEPGTLVQQPSAKAWTAAGGATFPGNGEIAIPVTNGTSGGAVTTDPLSIVGASVSCQVNAEFVAGREFYVALTDSSDPLAFDWQNCLAWYFESGYLTPYYMVDGTETAGSGVAITLPCWVKISESDGTVTWSYSEDGATWTDAQSVADPLPAATLEKVYFAASADQFEDSGAGTVTVSNVGSSTASVPAIIEGDYPARCRIRITDQSGIDQHAFAWALRSRHYDSAETAKSYYEAEEMTPLNGAEVVAGSGSVGDQVYMASIPTNAWTPVLLTSLADGSPLTHQGNYRVRARIATGVKSYSVRLVWGSGTLAAPVENDAVLTPATSGFKIFDLGIVRLAPQPVGSNAWYGVIQAYTTADAPIYIDEVWFESLDDYSGQAQYLPASSVPSAVQQSSALQPPPADVVDDASIGNVAWNRVAPGGTLTTAAGGMPNPNPYREMLAAFQTNNGGTLMHYCKATGYGFAIPTDATIKGIALTLQKAGGAQNEDGTGPVYDPVYDDVVSLVRAGVVETTNRRKTGMWPVEWATFTYGGTSDLWGASWTPDDINDANFGFVINASVSGNTAIIAGVIPLSITVYYTLDPGFAFPQDAAIYGYQTAEIRTEGLYRTPDGNVYGPISTVTGDLPRLPASGVEGRPCELLVRPSNGDLDGEPDSAFSNFTAQVFYRPSYLFRP